MTEHSADGHYVVMDGRRWRATDPAIPEPRRAELTRILMAWRREVRRTRGTDADLLGVRSGSIAASDFQQFCVDRAINGDSKT